MQDLRVIGVENGALLVASDDGTRFRIPIDEVLQSKLRQAVPEPGAGRKLAPREIQAHIRGGMSAQDVSSITGVPLEYIQKFEGPVMAEREFVVETALSVAVHTALETDPMAQGSTFGSVIRERLYDLGATGERWASWKETGVGWVVKLSFTADSIDHDARWTFDPKKLALSPQNGEAVTLSQQGEAAGALIPRLRAVGNDESDTGASRFDSGAFDLSEADNSEPRHATQPTGAVVTPARREETPVDHNQTSDLLEALRRRRGEREAASFEEEPPAPTSGVPSPMHPSTGSIRIVDIPLDHFDDEEEEPGRSTAPQPFLPSGGPQQGNKANRKGRQSMPSWDEIVFGARTDDDLA
ncbi:septation protein SepH [Glaciihabitans sp. dw_435]|uniref:septation protein SepH n=1 Tax=Glaciihabitans sp. dw_435 TaxID=2720081 RepID=UPI001BD4B51F|nr:septation protein SepH [Glaciihabitans sp. dw_435]